ncbi:hypothetical protein EDB84DRAFT_252647 [Lactarius hengduanensis]|nr:hypothetical protein EDB84DRAFT_252647 [Lactarius hengduanensis]
MTLHKPALQRTVAPIPLLSSSLSHAPKAQEPRADYPYRGLRIYSMLTFEIDPTKYDEVLKEVVKDYRNSILTKCFGVASFTILVWDHIITFPDEVELIWKGGKGHVVYLFFLNRYLIPLSFVVNLWAYFSLEGTLGSQSCSHFVRFEGSMTMIGISVVALMLFLRIRALYAGQLVVQAIVISILLTFVGVNSWLLTHGIPVPHYLATSCTMIVDPHVPAWIASSTAWIPLLYDTVVVSLTLYRTGGALYSASKSTGEIFRVMLREGLLYYSAICTVTLAFTIMIVSADPSVRNITAQLELCLTVAMMSRITLHLKRFGHGDTVISSYRTTPAPVVWAWDDPRGRFQTAGNHRHGGGLNVGYRGKRRARTKPR